ncbi:MAG TPA: V-type ATP synthase subunit A, partial [Clostridiales bacterium]|nr:V-type ATP synthase subunit A [Clostridiales bacterium]
YSEYVDDLTDYFNKNVGESFLKFRQRISNILIEENKLMEIVKLIGADVLPDNQKLIIETAKVIRVGFLQQNAYHKDDTYVPLEKQNLMMELILYLYDSCLKAMESKMPLSVIVSTGLFEKVIKVKYDIPNNDLGKFNVYKKEIDDKFKELSIGSSEWR